MKYNTLYAFRGWLSESSALSPATAETYFKAVDYLLKDQYFMDSQDIDIDKVVQSLKATKYKNQYSKYKNAFLKFCDYQNISLSDDIGIELDIMERSKKKKYRNLKSVKLKAIKNHIRVIRDKKLKLSFEVMLSTGLRVSELFQIKKQDCTINNRYVEFSFIGKGGKKEQVRLYKNKDGRVFENMLELINKTDIDKKVFYSAAYLQKQAKEKGFQCHDLRRAFAKVEYQECRDIKKVSKLLRHDNDKNTKIYLNSKIEI